MEKFAIEKNSTYENDGQAKEQSLRFVATGKMEKADHRRASECADLDDIQIKSARASVCSGSTVEDLDRHLATDKANRYAYVTKAYEVYLMTKEEYREFVLAFGFIDVESSQNGGTKKWRLRKESKAMLAYLISRAA